MADGKESDGCTMCLRRERGRPGSGFEEPTKGKPAVCSTPNFFGAEREATTGSKEAVEMRRGREQAAA